MARFTEKDYLEQMEELDKLFPVPTEFTTPDPVKDLMNMQIKWNCMRSLLVCMHKKYVE